MQTSTIDNLEKDAVLIDTRTPKEFENHHIPGAINIPLFENLQHHEIGYLYKQVSIHNAYQVALEYAQANVPRILSSFEQYKKKKLLIYCARGGLRSGIIVAFLRHHGYDAKKVEGGMKAFRNKVKQELETLRIPPIILLHGLVGAGKTKYIEALENKIDLEGCAQHMSSVFGAIGKKPNSQKQFLFELHKQLVAVQDKPFIFVEFESRKIGNVHIPNRFWHAMMQGEVWFLDVPRKERVGRYLKVFPQDEQHKQEYIRLTESLRGKMANKIIDEIITAFKENNYGPAWSLLWEHHYDPAYDHGTKHITIAKTIDASNFEKTLAVLREYERKRNQE